VNISQLFTEFKHVELPGFVDIEFGTHHGRPKKSFSILRWPNGKPCGILNAWLTEVSAVTTGQTTRQYCVNVTSCLRYCHREDLSFTDLNDSHVYKLVEWLCVDKKHSQFSTSERNNNQVIVIMQTFIEFLLWFQREFLDSAGVVLIGEKKRSARITVVPKKNPVTGEVSYTHLALPPRVAPEDDVRAMPDTYIEKIEDEIFRRSDTAYLPLKAKAKLTNNPTLFLARSEYVYARRMYMKWAMKRFGLRPSELIETSIPMNQNVLSMRMISLPTKKKRRDNAEIRHLKLKPDDCEHIVRYLDERNSFLEKLNQLGQRPLHQHSFFLTVSGTPLTTQSMTKDFSRLAIGAGLTNLKVCFSMFRHRFITKEILVHIKQILNVNKPNRGLLSEPVIRSICERIRKKTGHGSKASLWVYFDAAFDDIELWGGIDETLDAYDTIESLDDEAVRLRHQVLKQEGDDTTLVQLNSIAEQLRTIKARLSKPSF
jgi:hypothetical protein